MKRLEGGAKLINPSLGGFLPVLHMLRSPGARLSILSSGSLKGFIIELNVDEKHSQYTVLQGKRFTKKATSFILKIAVIGPDNDMNLDPFRGTNKNTESEESFFTEAKLQNEIWSSSIRGGRPAVCPSVANFAILPNDEAAKFLNFMGSIVGPFDTDFSEVVAYILGQLATLNASSIRNRDPEPSLGVLLMPKIEHSDIMYECVFGAKGAIFPKMSTLQIKLNYDYRKVAFAATVAQMIRLYIMQGILHFDLHAGNALVYLTKSGLNSMIIDFGRVSNVLDDTPDEYYENPSHKQGEKHLLLSYRSEFEQLLGASSRRIAPVTDNEKTDFITAVVGHIIVEDIFMYNKIYGKQDTQLSWYYDFINNVRNQDEVLLEIFNILAKLVVVDSEPRITAQTIQSYMQNGAFVDFSVPIEDFIVLDFNALLAEIVPSSVLGVRSRSRSRTRSRTLSKSPPKNKTKKRT
jgi:hypothetical protein